MTNVLILSPNKQDLVSRTCVEWSYKLEEYARSIGHDVYSMIDTYIDREIAENFVASHCPECLIIILSHGKEYGVIGSDGKCFLCVQSTAYTVGSVINAISCLSASLYGKEVVNSGAVGFLGYEDELLISFCAPSIPLNGFYETETMAARVLLNGGTLQQAYDATLQEYDRWIDCYRYEDIIVAGFMQLNKDAFVLYENPDYKPLKGECIAPVSEPCNCSYPLGCTVRQQQFLIIFASIAMIGLVSMVKKG